MKKILFLLCLSLATVAFAQSYRVTVETIVGNKTEDEFSFTLAAGETQFKGFDGKLLAKRYRANGFPHRIMMEEQARKNFEEKLDKESALKPSERIAILLAKAQKEYNTFDTKISTLVGKKEKLAEMVKELEKLESMATRGTMAFKVAYDEYLKKNGLTAEDMKLKKMMNKRPRNTGDIEEIDFGSFCKITLTKTSEKKVMLDFDYSYSRINSYFYADGNNNANTITKTPIIERVDKIGVKDLTISVGKPYCFQFTRLPPEKARSLSEAVADSGIFGEGDASKPLQVEKDPEATALDAEGAFVSIKKKYASDARKVIRVVITVRPEGA